MVNWVEVWETLALLPDFECARPEPMRLGYCFGVTVAREENDRAVIHSYTYEFEIIVKRLLALLADVWPQSFAFTTINLIKSADVGWSTDENEGPSVTVTVGPHSGGFLQIGDMKYDRCEA